MPMSAKRKERNILHPSLVADLGYLAGLRIKGEEANRQKGAVVGMILKDWPRHKRLALAIAYVSDEKLTERARRGSEVAKAAQFLIAAVREGNQAKNPSRK